MLKLPNSIANGGSSPGSRNQGFKSQQLSTNNINRQMKDLGGSLSITIIQGKLYRNTESIGKMDPFVELDYEGKKFTTKVIEEGHKNPLWNETFEIPIESLQDQLTISCYDQDSLSNDLIGELILPISQLCSVHEQWVDLQYKGKKAAEILISSNYTPPKETWNPEVRTS